jgi:hypothetical protein
MVNYSAPHGPGVRKVLLKTNLNEFIFMVRGSMYVRNIFKIYFVKLEIN